MISGADVIMLTNPSHMRPETLAKIVPQISKGKPVFLGALPGLGMQSFVGPLVAGPASGMLSSTLPPQ